MNDDMRLAALLQAEAQAERLFDAIEAAGLIAPGRAETAIEKDIYALAERDFGVTTHWHKRIVRAGTNTVFTAAQNPPVREIEEDDLVFIDVGPVFDAWEADFGRTYVIGNDPEKHRLCADLPRVFEALKQCFEAEPGITGAGLYAQAQRLAEQAGWVFAGKTAGHLVGEFPHALIPGDKDLYRIGPNNPEPMRAADAAGQRKHWILEVHLASPAMHWGGFYERLLQRA